MSVSPIVLGVILIIVVSFCSGVGVLVCFSFRRRSIEKELTTLITQNQNQFVILDVRKPLAFQQSHAKLALNIPFAQAKWYFPSENMFETVYVFGPTRRRTRLTKRCLNRNGYFNVIDYGAYRYWKGPKIIGKGYL